MEDYKNILQKYWGYPDFRGIQKEIIESIGKGQDTLGLMPTGGGKSITFQVPALAMEGVCIVITPLIALMKDQVDHLRERHIRADAIYSGMTRNEIIKILENAIFGGVKILYISPERLSSEFFILKLSKINVSFITIDEAHCISQWGYDFRPSYLEIAKIRKIKPECPILALTATATPKVVDDIQEKLEFKKKNVFKMSFERKNLAYVVRLANDKDSELIHILQAVEGCSIVYVRSRKHARDIALLLQSHNIDATFYHAGLDHYTKNIRQKAWQNDEQRVMVATNAFGMGIDKPQVRTVIHYDCPDSLEAYFQEAGRAGRDGKKAYAVLLYNNNDEHKLTKRIADNFPPKEYIRNLYDHLAYFFQIGYASGKDHTFTFDIGKFCVAFHHFPIQVDAALQILDRAGYIHYEMDPNTKARLHFLLERNDLYKLHDLKGSEEIVLEALLRTYTGLFSDYGYIDESIIAGKAGISRQQVYNILKSFSQRKLVHYIPQSKSPYITYRRDRIDGENIVLSKEIYEDRMKEYERRIHTVIKYANNNKVCRSQQLLYYFGEEKSTNCGHCDVCLEHQTNQTSKDRIEPVQKAILAFLSDKKKHHLTELESLGIPERQLYAALQQLLSEEIIKQKDSFLSL
jgi:ATP-dependent DNA helicase RecQ